MFIVHLVTKQLTITKWSFQTGWRSALALNRAHSLECRHIRFSFITVWLEYCWQVWRSAQNPWLIVPKLVLVTRIWRYREKQSSLTCSTSIIYFFLSLTLRRIRSPRSDLFYWMNLFAFLLAPSGALIAIPTYYWSTHHPPHFFRSHRSSTLDFHFLSH